MAGFEDAVVARDVALEVVTGFEVDREDVDVAFAMEEVV